MKNLTQKDIKTLLIQMDADLTLLPTGVDVTISNFPLAEGLLVKSSNRNMIILNDQPLVLSSSGVQTCIDSSTDLSKNPMIAIENLDDAGVVNSVSVVMTVTDYRKLTKLALDRV